MVLNQTDKELLSRLRTRSAELVRRYRRSIKHRPHIKVFDPRELETIKSLCDLERTAAILLDTTSTKPKGT